MSVSNRDKILTLEKRTMGIGVCCENCKFCKKYFVYDDIEGNDTCVHLCFVDGDISPEDDGYLLEVMQGAGNPWNLTQYDEAFSKLTLLPKGAESIEDSPRFVRCNEMCNCYLPEYANRFEG